MDAEDIVTDPALKGVLAASKRVREQALSILDFLNEERTINSEQEYTNMRLEHSKLQKRLNCHLTEVRGSNRKSIFMVRDTKKQTSEARQEVDTLHLQLQNLIYEQRHLKGEITACAEYDHKYKTLPLVPLEEFHMAHPESQASGEHELTIARIEHEHESRKAREAQRQVLLKKKEEVLKLVNGQKDEVAKLDATIETWLVGQENVRKMFEARREREEAAAAAEKAAAEEKEREASEKEALAGKGQEVAEEKDLPVADVEQVGETEETEVAGAEDATA